MKSKFLYLIKNVGFFTVSSFTTKILSFLIIPLYTYFLTTAEYAIIDLLNIGVSLLVPIVTLCIDDALLRFTIAKEYDKKYVFYSSLLINGIGILCMILVYPIICKFDFLNGNEIFFLIITCFTMCNNMFSKYARAVDRVQIVMMTTILNTTILLSLNIVFIVKLGMAEKGYFISMIVALVVSNLIYIINLEIPKLKLKEIDFKLIQTYLKNMLIYSIPLVPNALFWWINTAMDRVAINMLLSLSAVGMYAIANKIPAMLTVFTSVFHQAWNLSAFKEYDEKEYGFFEVCATIYISGMALLSSGLIATTKLIASIMFQNEFYNAWKFVPILLIAFFFNSINVFLGSLYTASKKTSGLFTTTLVGAIVNIILNFCMIPFLGAMGAAYATCISNIVVFVVRSLFTKQNFDIKINYIHILFVLIVLSLQSLFLLKGIMGCNVVLCIVLVVVTVVYINKNFRLYFKK